MQWRYLVDDKLIFIIARGRVSFNGDRPLLLSKLGQTKLVTQHVIFVVYFVEILVSQDNRCDKKLSGSC